MSSKQSKAAEWWSLYLELMEIPEDAFVQLPPSWTCDPWITEKLVESAKVHLKGDDPSLWRE